MRRCSGSSHCHFLGQSEPHAHFGLGPGVSRVHRLRVEFPGTGRSLEWHDVAANRELVVRESGPRGGLLGTEALVVVTLLGARRRRRPRAA